MFANELTADRAPSWSSS